MATHSSSLALKNPTDRGAWHVTVHGVTKETQFGMDRGAWRATIDGVRHNFAMKQKSSKKEKAA